MSPEVLSGGEEGGDGDRGFRSRGGGGGIGLAGAGKLTIESGASLRFVGVGNKENPANEPEEKEPEDTEMTLEEYEKFLEEKMKALVTGEYGSGRRNEFL